VDREKEEEMTSGHLDWLREEIEKQYQQHETGCGGSFGELLCYEIHERGLTFAWLADKWGLGLPTLGELIWDHCKRLEDGPKVDHGCRLSPDPQPALDLAKQLGKTKWDMRWKPAPHRWLADAADHLLNQLRGHCPNTQCAGYREDGPTRDCESHFHVCTMLRPEYTRVEKRPTPRTGL
jgi:hypothetical protein